MEKFRKITNTEGVDMKALTYQELCTKDGALQTTADLLDGLGFNAPDDNPFSPNAAILRTAEAVDSVRNSARSGFAATRRESGGMILCSMVQMGGIIYVAFILIIVFVLISCLPLCNLVTRTLFDLTVAACTASTSGGGVKKAGKGLAGAIQAQVAIQVKKAMADTVGGAARVPAGAAGGVKATATAYGHGAWGEAIGNVRIHGTDANGEAIYERSGTNAANTTRLSAGLRTALRRRRAEGHKANGAAQQPPKPTTTAVASLLNDARGLGRRLLGKGATETQERTSLLTKEDEQTDNSAYI